MSDTLTNTLHCRSPAKLNLFLHITGRRNDGYHELQTIFQLIDLFDELTFSLTPMSENIENPIDLADDGAISKQDNLIYRAGHALYEQAQRKHRSITGPVHVSLQKRIPMGAGLGGGSSNAATTLLALNKLWALNFNRSELADIAVTLGADVPLFVQQQSTWAEGIGEKLTPIKLEPSYFLVVTPNYHASTAKLFANPSLPRDTQPIPLPNHADAIDPIKIVTQYSNAFEHPLSQVHPAIASLLEELRQHGPSQVTGTGSSCFTVFKTLTEAEAIQHKLAPKLPHGYQLNLVQGLNDLDKYK